MSNEPTPTCPLPTPELVAALANAYIEERLKVSQNSDLPSPTDCMRAAFESVVGTGFAQSWRVQRLLETSMWLAEGLSNAAQDGHCAPYETQVTLLDGTKQPPERHTITHFVDGEGYTTADWSAISSLDVGATYVIAGQQAVMTVTRVE